MKSDITILTSTGFGYTGSSAGTNILEEFSSVTSFGNDFECTFIHEPDGLHDLAQAVTEGHRLKIDLAIKRFLHLAEQLGKDESYKKYFNGLFYEEAKQYISSLVDCKWNGWWHRAFDLEQLSFWERKKITIANALFDNLYKNKICRSYEPDGWQPSYRPITLCYYAHFQQDFYKKTKDFTAKLFLNSIDKNKFILADQLLPAYNIKAYSKYFTAIRTLVIDKDPRDLYALNKAEAGERYIPSFNVEVFIQWYKATRFERHKINTEWKDYALFLPFESLIYEYNKSLEKIKEFTGLTEDAHIRKRQFFNPEKSIVNTQLYKRYPQLKNDIAKIEKELSMFCFPFDKYPLQKIDKFSNNYIFIEDIYKNVQQLQLTGKLPDVYKFKFFIVAGGSTHFFSILRTIKKRKTKKSKLKGVVKAIFYLPAFPFELTFYLFFILFSFKIKSKQ